MQRAEQLYQFIMASATNAEIMDWPKNDKRRPLHAVYSVGDLDRTIK